MTTAGTCVSGLPAYTGQCTDEEHFSHI